MSPSVIGIREIWHVEINRLPREIDKPRLEVAFAGFWHVKINRLPRVIDEPRVWGKSSSWLFYFI